MRMLRKPVLVKPEEPKKTEKKEKSATKKRDLPPDEYQEEIPSNEVEIDETRKIVISVKRGGEDGLPFVDVRQYQMTEIYTGFTKKGINIPLAYLPDLIQSLQMAQEACEAKGLEFDE